MLSRSLTIMIVLHIPVNKKHLYNIFTMLVQHRTCTHVIQMFCVCWDGLAFKVFHYTYIHYSDHLRDAQLGIYWHLSLNIQHVHFLLFYFIFECLFLHTASEMIMVHLLLIAYKSLWRQRHVFNIFTVNYLVYNTSWMSCFLIYKNVTG